MIWFDNDYLKGAHPEVLLKLAETNLEPAPGYGEDQFSKRAAEKIKRSCGLKNAQVRFISGGTQTNAIVAAALLKDHEGVISSQKGHVATHEAGAIEYTGHKVLEIGHDKGKINAEELKQYLEDFYADETYEHMVFPGMVYISHPTEYGAIYSKAELEDISAICKEYKIPLYMDGARLGYALASKENDLSLKDIARLCDVFYIGGTKVGALCGEALVFTKNNMPDHFTNLIKKRGALMAKGRVIGVQFDALFTDGLYAKITKHAIKMAEMMVDILKKHNMKFYYISPTNQQFVIVTNAQMKKLRKKISFSFWEKYDENHTVIRFTTSWATTEEELEELDACLP